MTNVEFHILSEMGELARQRHACKLVEQSYAQAQRAYVLASDTAEAQRIDDMLWTFRDQAFIPHELLSDAAPTHSRIMAVIGEAAAAPEQFRALLINLSGNLPADVAAYIKICEVVDADPARKQQARERYKQYRELGCTLETSNHSSDS